MGGLGAWGDVVWAGVLGRLLKRGDACRNALREVIEVHGLLPRPRRGLRGIVFTRSVCLSVCVCVCVSVCPANILVFYFSAIRRDIDLKFIQDTYRVVLDLLK